MKTLALLAAATLFVQPAANFFAADKVSVKFSPKVGAVEKKHFQMKFSAGGMDVVVDGSSKAKITKVEGDTYTTNTEWSDLKAKLGDQDQEIPSSPLDQTLKLSGDFVKSSGGIEQLDNVRLQLMSMFVAPAAEIGEGETYKLTFAAVKDVQPAHTYSGTYVGKEKLGEVEALKFTGKYAESDKDGLSATITAWVLADGTVLKVVSKFTNFDIPPAGGAVSGEVTLTPAK